MVVKRLCQLCGHGGVEVRFVALQDALQGELADAEHLVVAIHHTPAPRTPVLVLKHTQVEDLSDTGAPSIKTEQSSLNIIGQKEDATIPGRRN